MNIQKPMDFVVLICQFLHGSLARQLLIRGLLFALAMMIFPVIQILEDARAAEPLVTNYDDCFKGIPSTPGSVFPRSMPCKEIENLTTNVFRELMSKKLLDSTAGKALCVGKGSASAVSALVELGFSDALGVDRHPFFSLLQRRFVYELDFKDGSFDFVFSRALDWVSVPALFVLEAERVLRQGGIGAMLVGAHDSYPGSLIRSATPVSSFLRSSNVVQVCGMGSFTLVIFRKKFDSVAYFEGYHLPEDCPSLKNSRRFIQYLEPLADDASGKNEHQVSYLYPFLNVSSRNRFVYISIGGGWHLNPLATLASLYPAAAPPAFHVYVIDHDPLALTSYVRRPGVTFVYHPGLAGNRPVAGLDSGVVLNDEEGVEGEGGLDFVAWLRKTVRAGDFVLVAMNARAAELRVLFELFERGAICGVDEVFLRCTEGVDCRNSMCEDCWSLFRSLRNSGVFAHRWTWS